MFKFFDLVIFSGTYSGVLGYARRVIEQNNHAYICVVSAHGQVAAQKNFPLKQAYKNAGLLVPDGMPLVWLSRLYRHPTERIYGPQLMQRLCELAQKKNYRVFFCGTSENNLQLLVKQLTLFYPRLEVCGFYAPGFSPLDQTELNRITKAIDQAKPQIVFCGLSTPKQEILMQKLIKQTTANVLVGAGAAFDFLSKSKPQAPAWMQASGLEWLFRLLQEPTRLFPRYFVTIPSFIYYVILGMFTKQLK